ncbi:hypothetical protein BB560_007226, partial [Smittium megazygosporum]
MSVHSSPPFINSGIPKNTLLRNNSSQMPSSSASSASFFDVNPFEITASDFESASEPSQVSLLQNSYFNYADSLSTNPSSNATSTESFSLENEFLFANSFPKIHTILTNSVLIQKLGKPLNFTINKNIAIGTNLGKVITLDFEGNIISILRPPSPNYGLVSSIAFSVEGSRIIVGYSEGFVTLWDWESATLKATISPTSSPKKDTKISHLRGSPISHVCFVSFSRHRFISADTKGNVFHHQIVKKIIRKVVSTPLIVSDELEHNSKELPSLLVDLEPLPRGPSPSPLDSLGIIAVLLDDSFLILQTQPSIKTIFSSKYTKLLRKNIGLGSISWIPPNTIYQTHFFASVAFAVNKNVFLYFLSVPNSTSTKNPAEFQVSITPYFQYKFFSNISTIQWINPLMLFLISTEGSVYVVDICSNIESKVFTFDKVKPLYQSWIAVESSSDIFDSLRYSISIYQNTLYILSSENIYSITLRNWQERILWLMHAGRFIEAVALCTGLYNGTSGQIVIDLPPISSNLLKLKSIEYVSPETLEEQTSIDLSRELLVGPKLTTLVQASLKFLFSAKYSENSSLPNAEDSPFTTANSDSSKNSKSASLLRSVYGPQSINSILASLLLVTIQACIATNKLDFLFKDTFEQICIDPQAELIFLETLEPFIENGTISQVSPSVLQSLIKCYSENPVTRKKLEECLILIDLKPHSGVLSFDIDGVLSVCSDWRMWRALFRIWADVLNDPVTPLNQILNHIEHTIQSYCSRNSSLFLQQEDWQKSLLCLQEEALVFFDALESSLCGLTYPSDDLRAPPSLAESFCTDTLYWLFKPTNSKKSISVSWASSNSNSQTYNNTQERFDPGIQVSSAEVSPGKYNEFGSESSFLPKQPDFKYHNLMISLFFSTERTLSVLTNMANCELIQKIVLVLNGNFLPQSPSLSSLSTKKSPSLSRSIRSVKKVKSGIQVCCDVLLSILRIHNDVISSNPSNTVLQEETDLVYGLSFPEFLPIESLGFIACFLVDTYVSNYPLIFFENGADLLLTRTLLNCKTERTFEKCENSIENLLKVCSPYSDIYSLIEDVKAAKFFKVLCVLYKKTRSFDLVITSYLDDPNMERKMLVFDQIQQLFLLNEDEFPIEKKASVSKFILTNIDKFCEIDPMLLAITVEKGAIHGIDHKTIIDFLFDHHKDSEIEYRYLDTLLNPFFYTSKALNNSNETLGFNPDTIEDINDLAKQKYGVPGYLSENQRQENIVLKYRKHVISVSSTGIMLSLLSLPLDTLRSITHRYISCLIKYDSFRVLGFVKTHSYKDPTTMQNLMIFEPENVIQQCKENGLTSVVIWLYLLQNKHVGALRIYLQQLENIITVEKTLPLYVPLTDSVADEIINLDSGDYIDSVCGSHPYLSNNLKQIPKLQFSGGVNYLKEKGALESNNSAKSLADNILVSRVFHTLSNTELDPRVIEVSNGCMYVCNALMMHIKEQEQLKNKDEVQTGKQDPQGGSDIESEIHESWN